MGNLEKNRKKFFMKTDDSDMWLWSILEDLQHPQFTHKSEVLKELRQPYKIAQYFVDDKLLILVR